MQSKALTTVGQFKGVVLGLALEIGAVRFALNQKGPATRL